MHSKDRRHKNTKFQGGRWPAFICKLVLKPKIIAKCDWFPSMKNFENTYLYLTPFQVTISTGYAVSLHQGGKSSLVVRKFLRAFGSWSSIPLSSSLRVWSRLHHRPKNKACTSFTPSPFSTIGLQKKGERKVYFWLAFDENSYFQKNITLVHSNNFRNPRYCHLPDKVEKRLGSPVIFPEDVKKSSLLENLVV